MAKAKAGRWSRGDLAQAPAALLRQALRRRELHAITLVRRYERLMERAAALRVSVNEATKAVLAAGYRSAWPEFRKIVNITLSRTSRFERLARGLLLLHSS